MSDELKPDTGGLAYLKPVTGEPTGLPTREGITPALTPEEWAVRAGSGHVHAFQGGVFFGAGRTPGAPGERGLTVNPETERHALAALALHGQPFGFTREGLDALRTVLRLLGPVHAPDEREAVELAEREIAKIAALLPPE